ncbi:MAG TPA: hypothetical protein VGM90_09025 [Kofleriaceae bacterium]
MKNKITGGAAKVTLQVSNARRGQGAPCTIQATASANGKVAAVYILVRGMESAEWKGDNNQQVRNSRTSFETRIQVAGPFDLVQGQTYTFQAQIELPANVGPTYRGQLINHLWEAQAGLDMPGNDPDSGWQAFQVD